MFVEYLVLFYVCASEIKGGPLDYTYNIKAEGWLKLYDDKASWSEAFARCDVDGGVIVSPLTSKIRDAVEEYLVEQGFKGTSILTGVQSDFIKGDFYSIEGFPLAKMPVVTNLNSSVIKDGTSESCIIWRIEKVDVIIADCDVEREYVCYKQSNSAKAVIGCGTRDSDYVYDARSGSCYKFHHNDQPWFKAYEKCNSEGAYLAIINSEVEQAVLKELLYKCPTDETTVTDCQRTVNMVSMGIRNWPNDKKSWLTIKRETLSESGFEKWKSGKPLNPVSARCVTLDIEGNYVNVLCETAFPFICEKEPDFVKFESACASLLNFF